MGARVAECAEGFVPAVAEDVLAAEAVLDGVVGAGFLDRERAAVRQAEDHDVRRVAVDLLRVAPEIGRRRLDIAFERLPESRERSHGVGDVEPLRRVGVGFGAGGRFVTFAGVCGERPSRHRVKRIGRPDTVPVAQCKDGCSGRRAAPATRGRHASARVGVFLIWSVANLPRALVRGRAAANHDDHKRSRKDRP
jgi:hypothetical protein